MQNRTTGKRFSLVYLDENDLSRDSDKARNRIALFWENFFRDTVPSISNQKARDALVLELGIDNVQLEIEWHAFEQLAAVVKSMSINDFLDSITVLLNLPRVSRHPREYELALAFVRRVFREENLAYEIDDQGGVHPLVDSVFSKGRSSAITALTGERYKATRDLVERTDEHMLLAPPDYRATVQAVFGANENLFKLMYDVPRLDAKTAETKIKSRLQCVYRTEKTAMRASEKVLISFKWWIEAAHFYRHEQGVAMPCQPPEDVALLLISQGLSYVRWLAQLDQLDV